jgi:hypothetical protein
MNQMNQIYHLLSKLSRPPYIQDYFVRWFKTGVYNRKINKPFNLIK